VAQTEPLPAESPLWKAPNLFLTPHTSGVSDRLLGPANSYFARPAGEMVLTGGELFQTVVDFRARLLR